ncbi:hypothetical protein EG68_07374 [Paragonimus skrjabini miyazakii]|uniref:SOCS box domain-containing protein n=1 Tax=Paragonimus skrjabini miyazakii TaxID=59628 RepID=A0A8S9YLL3_9TREM|nr:hypothetical protein EG68_07374 [Paragonimus skrjabini miyazakii]
MSVEESLLEAITVDNHDFLTQQLWKLVKSRNAGGCIYRLFEKAIKSDATRCLHSLLQFSHSNIPAKSIASELLVLADRLNNLPLLMYLTSFLVDSVPYSDALRSRTFGPGVMLVWPKIFKDNLSDSQARFFVKLYHWKHNDCSMLPIRACYAKEHTILLLSTESDVGPVIAFIFELLLSNPELRYRTVSCVDHSVVSPYSNPGQLYSDTSCTGYPDCLTELVFRWSCHGVHGQLPGARQFWLHHRFGSVNGNYSSQLSPPTLLSACRTHIRRYLVRRILSEASNGNYVHLVLKLPLPSGLRNYLLFTELWPSSVNFKYDHNVMHWLLPLERFR